MLYWHVTYLFWFYTLLGGFLYIKVHSKHWIFFLKNPWVLGDEIRTHTGPKSTLFTELPNIKWKYNIRILDLLYSTFWEQSIGWISIGLEITGESLTFYSGDFEKFSSLQTEFSIWATWLSRSFWISSSPYDFAIRTQL